MDSKKLNGEWLHFVFNEPKMLWLSLLFIFCQSLEFLVVYDNEIVDPLTFSEGIFSKIPQITELKFCYFLAANECVSENENVDALFDVTNSLYAQYELIQLCQKYSIIHFVFRDNLEFNDEWTYSLKASRESSETSFFAVLDYFNWTKGAAFISNHETELNKQLVERSGELSLIIVESQTHFDELVEKMIVQLGVSVYYLFTHSYESGMIIDALESSKLLGEGNGLLLSQISSYGLLINGTLILTEKNQEYTETHEEYLTTSISSMISFLLNATASVSDIDLRSRLNSVCKMNYCQSEFSLINVQNGSRVIVASVEESVTLLNSTLVFLGNSSSIPLCTKKILNLSISGGTTNPGGAPSAGMPSLVRGAYLAIKAISETPELLTNFQFEMFNLDCGVSRYDANYTYQCFEKARYNVGLASIAPAGSTMVIGAFRTLKQLNLTFPMVGVMNPEESLSSIANYPFYTRVMLSNAFSWTQIPVLLKALGWNDIAVIYQNDSSQISAHNYIKKSCKSQNINIVNQESSRAIPPSLERDALKANYTYVLQEVIDSKVRLLILSMQTPMCNYLLELFYDLGVRKGDLLIVIARSSWPVEVGKNDTTRYKRIEVGVPMLKMDQLIWVGTTGTKLYSDLVRIYKSTPISYQCYYYDGMLLIAHALDWMINRGLDYRDPYKLQTVIRNTQFEGCTGKVWIENGSNDRAVDSLTIEMTGLNANNEIVSYIVGDFNPYSSTLLTIDKPIIYADGTTVKPSDFRIYEYDCPFPDEDIHTFAKGRGLVFGICFALAAITAVVTFLIWKRWWNIPLDELKERHEISVQDFIVGGTIAIELFQFASMGPDFRPISDFVADIGDGLSLDLGNLIELQNGVFWVLTDIVLGFTLLWAALCFVVLLQLDEKLARFSFFRLLGWLGDNLMPILGNLCFIPFMSILLDVFVCDESIGNNFTDSFLAKDCYQFCWKGEHLPYAILSGIALLAYEPLAVFCRPLWQEFQSSLHVKTSPLFLMMKTVVQMTLIVMNKTVKRADDKVHGILFLIILILYIILIFWKKPYNYPRFSWWQGLSLICTAWLSFLSTINIFINDRAFPWIAIVFAGWIAIICIGLAVQRKKYPSLLFRPKGHDASTLFQFAFRFSSKVSSINISKKIPKNL